MIYTLYKNYINYTMHVNKNFRFYKNKSLKSRQRSHLLVRHLNCIQEDRVEFPENIQMVGLGTVCRIASNYLYSKGWT